MENKRLEELPQRWTSMEVEKRQLLQYQEGGIMHEKEKLDNLILLLRNAKLFRKKPEATPQ